MASLIGAVVTVDRDLIGEIPLEDRDSYLGSTHFRLREGSTGTVEAIGVLRDEDVVRLRLPSGVVCIVKVDDLDDVSAEERDAIRHFTSSVVHKADNDGGGVDEVSSTSEEDSDDDDKDEDPDHVEGSRKRPAANGAGSGKRRTPEDGPRKKRPNEMPPVERAEHELVKAEKKAKEDAAGALKLKAAVKAFEASSWVEKDNYVAIVDELKIWVARGGTAATAAGWIRRLMIATKQKKGGEGYTPSTVRTLYSKTPPGKA